MGAAASIKELKTLVDGSQSFVNLPNEIKDIVDDEFIKREAKMQYFTTGLLSEFCDFSNERDLQMETTLFKSKLLDLKENTIDWDDMLTILDLTDNLDSFLMNLANMIGLKVIPMLGSNCKVSLFKLKARTHLQIAENVNDLTDVQLLSQNITTLAEFITSIVFPGDIGPSDTFVDMWSEKISSLVRQSGLGKKSALSDTDMECIKELEVKLMTLDLLSPAFFPLINNEIHHNQKMLTQRIDLLLQVKEVLCNSDPNLVVVSEGTCRGGFFSKSGEKMKLDFNNIKAGKESIDKEFCLSEFSISNQAQILSDVIFSLLENLVAGENDNHSILSTVRDIFIVFRAVNSIYFLMRGNEFNDCLQ